MQQKLASAMLDLARVCTAPLCSLARLPGNRIRRKLRECTYSAEEKAPGMRCRRSFKDANVYPWSIQSLGSLFEIL